jgi:TM2 domain-containing membrane protein YozV
MMNPSVKAALLSALIFPGVGQISLGRKKRGWFIISVNVVIIYFIISEVMQKAYAIAAEIQKNGGVIDIESISNTTSGMVGFSDNTSLNILLTLIIVGWVISVIDAYRLGLNN